MSMIGNLLRVTKEELEAYKADSSLLENRIYNEDGTEDPKLSDVDKAWDGILFLLTGQNLENNNHPLAKIFFSRQTIDDAQDLGYGPGYYVEPDEVVELSEQLSAITIEDLKKKYDPKIMTEMDVYPTIWDEGDEAFSYLAGYFEDIQSVYAEAAKNGEAIITFIS